MADRKVLVGDIDGLTGIIAHGSFDAGDTLVDPLGNAIFPEVGASWFYGDGSDGSATISSNTTFNTNYLYENLTIAAGVTVTLAGYMLLVRGTLTLENGAVIQRNGNNAVTSTGGATLAPQVYGGAGAGANQNQSAVNTNATNTFAGSGGNGGSVTGAVGGSGQPAVAPIASVGGLVNRSHLVSLSTGSVIGSTAKFSGGGGGGGGGASGGTAGGGGGGGGVIVIFANEVVVPTGTALISANGGNGAAGSVNNGGGGGGGGGGVVIVVSANAQPAGLTLQANGGTGGAKGPTAISTAVGAPGSAGFTAFYVWS